MPDNKAIFSGKKKRIKDSQSTNIHQRKLLEELERTEKPKKKKKVKKPKSSIVYW